MKKSPSAKSSIAALVVAVALALGLRESATAASTSTPLSVAVAVNIRCSIVTGTMNFSGAYVSNQPTAMDAQTSVTVACDAGRKVSIRMGQGLYPAPASTDVNPLRRMANGSYRLTYQLYEDAARTTVWDNRSNAVRTTRAFPYTATIYGRIPGSQTVTAGTYSDTVVATVYY